MYELLLDTGDATPSRLTVSETHPFYVPARGWVESQSLNPGDVIETDTFSAAVVISLNDLHRREATYNFTVDEFHSYHVSQDRVLVHHQDEIVCELTGEGVVTKSGGYDRPEIETKSGVSVKQEGAVDRWDYFLGSNQTNIDPRDGLPDPDRLWSADGKRSIRFDEHEMNSKLNKMHYHQETWHADKVENVLQRIPALKKKK